MDRLAKAEGPQSLDAKAAQKLIAYWLNPKDEAAQVKVLDDMQKLAKAKGEAAAITGQVSALDRQIDALNRQMGVDTRAIHHLESSIRTDDAKIAQITASYEGAHAAANNRARSIYIGGPANSLSSLLSASSIGDFMRKSVVWQVAAQLDGKVIIQSARLRGALEVERQDLARSRPATRRPCG